MFNEENLIINNIYIISYLSQKDINMYKIRKKCILKQLIWILSQNIKVNIKYIIQCWPEEFIKEFDNTFNKFNKNNCSYEFTKIFDKPIIPAKVRNFHLNNFYNSDENISLFIDDDNIIETYDKKYSIFDFFYKYFLNLNFDTMNFKGCRYRNIKRDFCILSPSLGFNSGSFLIKNLYKKYNKKIFFDEDFTALEDMNFGLELGFNKFKNYECEDPYFKELTAKSILFSGMDDRKEKNNKARILMYNKWFNKTKCNNLLILKNNKLYKDNFKKLFLKHKKIIINE